MTLPGHAYHTPRRGVGSPGVRKAAQAPGRPTHLKLLKLPQPRPLPLPLLEGEGGVALPLSLPRLLHRQEEEGGKALQQLFAMTKDYSGALSRMSCCPYFIVTTSMLCSSPNEVGLVTFENFCSPINIILVYKNLSKIIFVKFPPKKSYDKDNLHPSRDAALCTVP